MKQKKTKQKHQMKQQKPPKIGEDLKKEKRKKPKPKKPKLKTTKTKNETKNNQTHY